MKAKEFLKEYRLHKTSLGNVIQNPSAEQLKNLIARTKDNRLRGVATEKNLWVADAFNTIHPDIENEFLTQQDERWVRMYFSPDEVSISGWDGDWGFMDRLFGTASRDDVEAVAFNFPSVKRAMQ